MGAKLVDTGVEVADIRGSAFPEREPISPGRIISTSVDFNLGTAKDPHSFFREVFFGSSVDRKDFLLDRAQDGLRTVLGRELSDDEIFKIKWVITEAVANIYAHDLLDLREHASEYKLLGSLSENVVHALEQRLQDPEVKARQAGITVIVGGNTLEVRRHLSRPFENYEEVKEKAKALANSNEDPQKGVGGTIHGRGELVNEAFCDATFLDPADRLTIVQRMSFQALENP